MQHKKWNKNDKEDSSDLRLWNLFIIYLSKTVFYWISEKYFNLLDIPLFQCFISTRHTLKQGKYLNLCGSEKVSLGISEKIIPRRIWKFIRFRSKSFGEVWRFVRMKTEKKSSVFRETNLFGYKSHCEFNKNIFSAANIMGKWLSWRWSLFDNFLEDLGNLKRGKWTELKVFGFWMGLAGVKNWICSFKSCQATNARKFPLGSINPNFPSTKQVSKLTPFA